jgi:two-component system, OmpR family, response regulator ResD
MLEISSLTPVPILMLTARGEVKDKVLGLGIGADDYVVKPVDPEELIARIYALLRRSSQQAHAVVREQKLTFPDLTIYPERRQVVVLNENIDLTQKEYDILQLLAQHPQRTFERDAVVERLWGNDFLGENRVIDTHIKNTCFFSCFSCNIYYSLRDPHISDAALGILEDDGVENWK